MHTKKSDMCVAALLSRKTSLATHSQPQHLQVILLRNSICTEQVAMCTAVRPVDARQPPVILVLQVAAIAEAEDLLEASILVRSPRGPSYLHAATVQAEQARLHRQEVAPWLQEVGDLELGRQAAVLAVAEQLAVQPGVHRIVHGLKIQEGPAQHQPLRSVPPKRTVT